MMLAVASTGTNTDNCSISVNRKHVFGHFENSDCCALFLRRRAAKEATKCGSLSLGDLSFKQNAEEKIAWRPDFPQSSTNRTWNRVPNFDNE